jgi:thymidylate synthase
VSTLPPCHYTAVFNAQNGVLNLHLTQRSGDIALGIPFNIAAYSMLLQAVAQEVDMIPGTFAHTIVDAHIYCGASERGEWYEDNLYELRQRVRAAVDPPEYDWIADWIDEQAPDERDDEDLLDHVPDLLRQVGRDPYERPTLEIADKPLDDLTAQDIELTDYDPHPGIKFGVAE